jgi:hypothetical protein
MRTTIEAFLKPTELMGGTNCQESPQATAAKLPDSKETPTH